jgi:RimJ/RimL family protein N-acetyltransferase
MAASRDELQRWMVWAGGEPSRERNLAFLEGSEKKFDDDLDWGYAMTEGDGEVVGGCGLHPREDPEHPEIGYWVRSDRTGRGYATSAARALADAAFQNLPYIDQVKVRMDQGNIASAAVPPKLGFRLEREEDRPIETTGHTGRGFIWVLDRPS